MRPLRVSLVVLAVLALVVYFVARREPRGPSGATVPLRAATALDPALEPAPALAVEAPPPVAAGDESARTAVDASPPEAPALQPAEAPWIVRGVLTGPDGRPLPAGRVWTWTVETSCDANGAFELVLPRRRAQDSLFASAPGHAELEQAFTFPDGAHEAHLELRLGPAFQARGRVLDEEGRAVAGATVSSFYSRKGEATSGLDGEFLLDHLSPGRPEHHVRARKEGYVPGEARVRTQGLLVEGLELVLTRGTPVEGLVLAPDGAPLADAVLYIGFSPHAFDRLDATSDAQGAFRFPNVGAGARTLVAQHPRFSARKEELEVPAHPPGLAPLVLRLEPAHWIAGRIVDGAGSALAGVMVAGMQEGEYLELDTVTSDAEGRFRLEGLPGEGASLEFYGQEIVREEVALERVDHDGLVVELARAARVGGLVLDAATRAPIERFLVRFFEPELGPGEQGVTGYSARWIREGQAFTSADGTWTSAGEELDAGAVTGVEVQAEGYAPARVSHVVASLELDPRAVVFELVRGGAVRGQVLDADGAPVSGARVFCAPAGVVPRPGYEDLFRSGFTATEGDGRFAFADVPPGSTQLTVYHDALPGAVDGPFPVVAGSESVRVVQLGRGGVLEGLSLDAHASPVGGVPIRIVALDASGRPQGLVREQRADAAGAFRFAGLEAGEYQITRLFPGDDTPWIELQTRAQVATEAVTQVTLRPLGRAVLEGRLALASGKLPARLLVLATRVGSEVPLTRGALASDGVFRFEALAPGRWEVHANLFRQDRLLRAQATLDLADAEHRSVELELR